MKADCYLLEQSTDYQVSVSVWQLSGEMKDKIGED